MGRYSGTLDDPAKSLLQFCGNKQNAFILKLLLWLLLGWSQWLLIGLGDCSLVVGSAHWLRLPLIGGSSAICWRFVGCSFGAYTQGYSEVGISQAPGHF